MMSMLQQKIDADAGLGSAAPGAPRPALRVIEPIRPIEAFAARDGAEPDPRDDDRWSVLMAAGRAGDAASYRQLLTEINRWLCRYYARRLPAAMVEDAAQETLIAIHQRRHTYEPDRPFKAWLVAIARYKWIDRLRSLSREPTTVCADDVYEAAAIEDHGTAVTSAIVLDDLLAQLKPAQSQVIRLVRLEGYSIEEASRRTGQSQALVKVNIHRGIARLSALSERQHL